MRVSDELYNAFGVLRRAATRVSFDRRTDGEISVILDRGAWEGLRAALAHENSEIFTVETLAAGPETVKIGDLDFIVMRFAGVRILTQARFVEVPAGLEDWQDFKKRARPHG